jgi:bifunctional ADP-heptose synthase (sugar kinase/adenylyltransferase)
MTLRPVERRQYDGGAAIIARHIAAMGAKPVLVTALPRDDQGLALRRRMLAEGVEVHAIETDRPLCEKQRFLVGTQKVMKLDLLEPVRTAPVRLSAASWG